MTLWVVKGGRHGQMEERYLAHSVVGIGWEDIPSLDRFRTVKPSRARTERRTQAARMGT